MEASQGSISQASLKPCQQRRSLPCSKGKPSPPSHRHSFTSLTCKPFWLIKELVKGQTRVCFSLPPLLKGKEMRNRSIAHLLKNNICASRSLDCPTWWLPLQSGGQRKHNLLAGHQISARCSRDLCSPVDLYCLLNKTRTLLIRTWENY